MPGEGPPSTPSAEISTARRGCRHDVVTTTVPPSHYVRTHAARPGHLSRHVLVAIARTNRAMTVGERPFLRRMSQPVRGLLYCRKPQRSTAGSAAAHFQVSFCLQISVVYQARFSLSPVPSSTENTICLQLASGESITRTT